MFENSNEGAQGTWRRGETVRWQDLFVPVEAGLVWLGLITVAIAVAIGISGEIGVSKTAIQQFAAGSTRQFVTKQLSMTTFYLVLLFFLWRIARRVDGAALVARFRPIGWVSFAIALLGGVALAFATTNLISELATRSIVTFHVAPSEHNLVPSSPGELPYALLAVSLAAPLAEEFYFRGVLLSWLSRKMFVPLAALLSAAVFALLHFRFVTHPGPEGWVYSGVICFLGLTNATLALRTHSLWGPVAVHAGYNAALITMAALAATHAF